jgi:hypothetical protein
MNGPRRMLGEMSVERQGAQFDLSMRLGSFNLLIGIGWQLSDDVLVRFRIEQRDAPVQDLRDLPSGIRRPCGTPATKTPQYLAVRVGPWECVPDVDLTRYWEMDPGCVVQLGKLRQAWKDLITSAHAMWYVKTDHEKTMLTWTTPVRLRFPVGSLVVEYHGEETVIPREEP